MKSHQKIHQVKLGEWATIIADQKASGLTIKEWCLENNISIHKYNYWKHLIKEALSEQLLPDIVQIELPDSNTAISSTELPIANNTNRANRSISTTDTSLLPQLPLGKDSTNCANGTNRAKVNFSINGLPIEIDSDAPTCFLKSLIKAVYDV